LRLSHLSAAEKRAYILADNKLAEKAGWDREILAIELQGLIDLEFEMDLIGFEAAEIDLILDDAAEASPEGDTGSGRCDAQHARSRRSRNPARRSLAAWPASSALRRCPGFGGLSCPHVR
jgi:hypothetical protein